MCINETRIRKHTKFKFHLNSNHFLASLTLALYNHKMFLLFFFSSSFSVSLYFYWQYNSMSCHFTKARQFMKFYCAKSHHTFIKLSSLHNEPFNTFMPKWRKYQSNVLSARNFFCVCLCRFTIKFWRTACLMILHMFTISIFILIFGHNWNLKKNRYW